MVQLLQKEDQKEELNHKLIEVVFRDSSEKTVGTNIDEMMQFISRFGGGNHTEKKQGFIVKLLTFFERFFGIG
ncbi:MAG: hypothetical protein IJA67_04645 [Oscillospiraceae bacterium]|nr:hypothetical protein [Oscillospiraceae bacterium]